MVARFVLDREVDPTGISGTGLVAEGVQFWDGTVALRWRNLTAATGVYGSIQDVVAIHGHDGSTKLKWIDTPIHAERKKHEPAVVDHAQVRDKNRSGRKRLCH